MALYPVGPLPASTYWRRRAVVLVGLLVLLLVLRSCASGGTPKHKASATPKPTPTSATASPVPSATTAAVGLCPDTALTVTATTDAATYGLGATPRITLSVKNTSAAACRRDLGAGAVELLVYSGADRIWSSDDCNPSKAVSLLVLPPGGSQAVVKTWQGKRSKPGCTGAGAAAAAGTYKIVVRVGALRQDGGVFRIHS